MSEAGSFDVAVIGGGIGGTLLATILARNGVRVLVVEGGSHPRFTIGESTTPETTVGIRVLAYRYGVPELKHLSNYAGVRKHLPATSGVKRNFSFVHHRQGEPLQPKKCNQYLTFSPPFGPDMHYFRQDVDAYLFSLALSYGAVGHTDTQIADVRFDQDGVWLDTKGKGSFHAQYVVDAGGPRAIIPQVLGLRQEPCPLETQTRTMFTHMVRVTPYERVGPAYREHGLPSPLSQGTLHHIFKGGWLWVIPFNNHPLSSNQLCSVGLTLNLAEFPEQDLSPEEEFWSIVNRFPGIAAQLKDAKPVRGWVRSKRIQFSSSQVIGDRYCLMPHAANFVDPLFSAGLAITVMAVNALAHRLIAATRENDYATERFEYVNTWVGRMVSYNDQLVKCSYIAFEHFELWNAWYRVWMLGTLYGTTPLIETALLFEHRGDPSDFERLERHPLRGLQAVDHPVYWRLFTSAVAQMNAVRDQSVSPAQAAENIYRLIADSKLSPSTWKITDSDERCPAGTFTIPRMLRLLFWGVLRSPDYIRNHYFYSWPTQVKSFAADFFGSEREEIHHGATGAWGFFRDAFVGPNRDWARWAVPSIDGRLRTTGYPVESAQERQEVAEKGETKAPA